MATEKMVTVHYVEVAHHGAVNIDTNTIATNDVAKFFDKAEAQKHADWLLLRRAVKSASIRTVEERLVDQHHAHGGEVGRMTKVCANDTCFETVVSGIPCKKCGVITY